MQIQIKGLQIVQKRAGDTMYKQRIRDLREDKDLSQKEMAEYLQIHQTTYSDYERGT